MLEGRPLTSRALALMERCILDIGPKMPAIWRRGDGTWEFADVTVETVQFAKLLRIVSAMNSAVVLGEERRIADAIAMLRIVRDCAEELQCISTRHAPTNLARVGEKIVAGVRASNAGEKPGYASRADIRRAATLGILSENERQVFLANAQKLDAIEDDMVHGGMRSAMLQLNVEQSHFTTGVATDAGEILRFWTYLSQRTFLALLASFYVTTWHELSDLTQSLIDTAHELAASAEYSDKKSNRANTKSPRL
jgi:hypothetical protein